MNSVLFLFHSKTPSPDPYDCDFIQAKFLDKNQSAAFSQLQLKKMHLFISGNNRCVFELDITEERIIHLKF